MSNEHIGRCLLTLKRRVEATAALERSVAISAEVLAVRPDERTTLAQALSAEQALIESWASDGRTPEAINRARKLVAKAERALEKGPDIHLRSAYVAGAYLTLASVYRTTGDWTNAQAASSRAATIAKPLVTGRIHDRNSALLQEARAIEQESKARLLAVRH